MTWDPPSNVSDDPANSVSPRIVADPWGLVHLFWEEKFDDSPTSGSAIFYSRWDGTTWSRPVDVLMSPEGSRAYSTEPVAVALPNGRLAVVWAGGWGDKIYFSTAPAAAAGAAHAWSTPRALVADRPGAAQPRIALDAKNTLHVLYLHHEGQDQGLWHLSSTDGGQSWTEPRRLPGTYIGKPNVSIFHPAFAIDGSGTLHAAWSGSSVSGSFPPDGIYYSRSEDGGDTWSGPVTLASGPFSLPVFGTRGAKEVHLMWSGTADQRRKFYQWSNDGGLSWSRPGTIGESGGIQGTAQIVVDGDGELHLAFVSSHPVYGDSLFHSRWLGGGWSEPELLLKGMPVPQNQANAVATISGGNMLHVAVAYPLAADNSDGWQVDIFAIQGHLPARAIATSPLPPTAPPQEMPTTPAPRSELTASPAPSAPLSVAKASAVSPPEPSVGPLLGIVPVLLLMAAVVLFYGARRR